MDFINYYKSLQDLKKSISHDTNLTKILKKLGGSGSFAFARFNDGEMMGIEAIGSTVARGDQVVDKSLHDALKRSISYKQNNYIVGVPCIKCYPKYYQLAMSLVTQDEDDVINAVSLTNRNWLRCITDLPDAAKNRRILWISGDDQNVYFLRKEMGLNIVGHQKYSPKNSWKDYNIIKENYEKLNDELFDTVMISLGPTARIFVQEMFEKHPEKTFIDIGSTYDPFTRNVWHNCHKGWVESKFNLTRKCQICN